jgi:hypothetical protein
MSKKFWITISVLIIAIAAIDIALDRATDEVLAVRIGAQAR